MNIDPQAIVSWIGAGTMVAIAAIAAFQNLVGPFLVLFPQQWPVVQFLTKVCALTFGAKTVTPIGSTRSEVTVDAGKLGTLKTTTTEQTVAGPPVLPPAAMYPVLGILAGLGATVLCSGCSMESARYRRAARAPWDESVKMAQSTRPAEWCKKVDDWHVGLEIGGGVVVAPIGAAAGIVAAADTSEKIEKIAIGTGLGALAVETLVLAADGKLVSIWTEQGCGQ